MSSYILGTKPQHWAISVMRVRARETVSSDPTTLASQVSVKCWKSTLTPVFSMAFLSIVSRPITFLSKTSFPKTILVSVYLEFSGTAGGARSGEDFLDLNVMILCNVVSHVLSYKCMYCKILNNNINNIK